MGNMLGNLLGFAIVIFVAVISLFSLSVGVVTFAIVAYVTWLLVLAGDLATRPRRNVPLAALLTSGELGVYRKYHTCLWFPEVGPAFSALLNLIRVAGFVWAGLALWIGHAWVGAALVGYFFLVGSACLRFDPVRYLAGAAGSGNEVAREQLLLLQSVEKKRAVYNASD
jgi:hypothetical protein